MKTIQKYLILGLLFSLRIDSSDFSQLKLLESVELESITEKLHNAVRFDDDEMMRLLLEDIIKMPRHSKTRLLNNLDSHGFGLLHIAVNNNPIIMELLLQAGANPNIQIIKNENASRMGAIDITPGATPLHLVAEGFMNQFGKAQVDANKVCFDLLIKYGADPAAINFNGYTILHVLAVCYNQNWLHFANAAFAANVDVNAQTDLGETALHLLAQCDRPYTYEFAEKLLENRADPTIKDEQRKTPFDYISPKNPDKIALKKLLEPYSVENDKIEKKIEKNNNTIGILKKVKQDKKQNQKVRFNDNAEYDDGDMLFVGGDKERFGSYDDEL